MKRSLYWRIVWALMGVLFLSSLLNTAFLTVTVRGVARRTQEGILERFARFAARQMSRGISAGMSRRSIRRALKSRFVDFTQLQLAFAPLGKKPIGTSNAEPALLAVASRGGPPGLVKLGPWTRKAGIAPVMIDRKVIGTVAVAVARKPLVSIVAMIGWLGILTIPLLFAISALVGVVALRSLRRRLDPVTEVLEAVRGGDLSCRLPERGGIDEVDELFVTFNQMVARLETTVNRLADVDRKRRDFLIEVAHELKTPLTAVEGSLESMVIRAADSSQDEAHLSRAYGESVRIRGLVADLLESARMAEPRYSLSRGPCNLQRLLTRVIERYSLVLERKGIQVVTAFTSDPIVGSLDERRMEQVAGNLIQNSLDHAGPGGTLRVSVHRAGDQIELEFLDDGEGISQERLNRIRANAAAEAPPVEESGSGVGLFIVGKLVVLHGGQIKIESPPGAGTRVTVTLPG